MRTGRVQIEGRADLQRDMSSRAVICVDRNKLLEAKTRQKLMREKNSKVEQLERDVQSLKDSMDRMEGMLRELLNRGQ